jgi:hypothetical protein
MSKMGSRDPFEHLKLKLWPKKRSWVKLVVWLLTTKSQESPQFPHVKVACYIPLESSQWGLQLCFRPHFNWRSARKVMGPQSCKSPNYRNFRTPTFESVTKCHLDVGPVANHKVYYKGEGGGFPQLWAMVSLVSSNLPMVRPCTKNVSIMH